MTANSLSTMFNGQKLIDRLFRRADNVVWDLMTGSVGYRTAEGIVTLERNGSGDDETFQTVINPMDGMGMEVPAFAQQTPLSAVNKGDMILQNKSVGWVTEIKGASIKLIRPDGSHSTFTPPKTQLLDFGSGVMVVRSLLNSLSGGASGLGQMQSMMVPLMMMGGDLDMEKIMPMMLMMGGNQPAAPNPDGTTAPNPMGGMNMQSMMPMLMLTMMMNKDKDKDHSAAERIGGPFRR